MEEKDALKEMVRLQEEQAKKSQRILLLIPLIIVGIIVLISLIGLVSYFVVNVKSSKSIETDWGKTYYAYLKDNKKNTSDSKIPDNSKLKFIDVKDVENPVMVTTYKFKEKNYTNIYFIEENKVNAIIYQDPAEINILYNIEKEEYNYYFHTESDTKDNYSVLDSVINNNLGEDEDIELEPVYTFDKEKSETIEDETGEIIVTEFDKVFIDPKIEEQEFDYNEDLNNKELKDIVSKSESDFKESEDLVTSDIEEKIEEKIKELEENLEILEKNNIENTFNMFKGVWYNEQNSTSFYFDINNGKKEFALGWFASEAVMKGTILDIKYKGNETYEVIVDDIVTNKDASTIIDASDIKNKKLKINNTTYKYIAANMDKAYEKLLY